MSSLGEFRWSLRLPLSSGILCLLVKTVSCFADRNYLVKRLRCDVLLHVVKSVTLIGRFHVLRFNQPNNHRGFAVVLMGQPT